MRFERTAAGGVAELPLIYAGTTGAEKLPWRQPEWLAARGGAARCVPWLKCHHNHKNYPQTGLRRCLCGHKEYCSLALLSCTDAPKWQQQQRCGAHYWSPCHQPRSVCYPVGCWLPAACYLLLLALPISHIPYPCDKFRRLPLLHCLHTWLHCPQVSPVACCLTPAAGCYPLASFARALSILNFQLKHSFILAVNKQWTPHMK